MRQLLPSSADVDPYDAARPADPDRPPVRLNFVSSLDGSVTDEQGRSGGLGGTGDRDMFQALRAHADAILVGAGTARLEGYGPHRLRPEFARRRAADGREQPAAIVVVTRSGNLDFSAPLFREAVTPTILLTSAALPPDRLEQAQEAGRVVMAGDDRVDLAEGLRLLRVYGMASVLCEGGPRLAARMVDDHLVDELCLTLAPALIGRESPRIVPALDRRVDGDLTTVHAEGSELFLRYRLRR